MISVTKVEQLDQLVEGMSVRLTDEEATQLEAACRPHPVIGHE